MELKKHYPESVLEFEGILIKPTDYAQVWYDDDLDQFIIRHVIHEGPFAAFVQHEGNEEFADHLTYNNWYFIGEL